MKLEVQHYIFVSIVGEYNSRPRQFKINNGGDLHWKGCQEK
jgi:hypothetical protein